jgi:hypothetical protein
VVHVLRAKRLDVVDLEIVITKQWFIDHYSVVLGSDRVDFHLNVPYHEKPQSSLGHQEVLCYLHTVSDLSKLAVRYCAALEIIFFFIRRRAKIYNQASTMHTSLHTLINVH